jgi:hypothetical protein
VLLITLIYVLRAGLAKGMFIGLFMLFFAAQNQYLIEEESAPSVIGDCDPQWALAIWIVSNGTLLAILLYGVLAPIQSLQNVI